MHVNEIEHLKYFLHCQIGCILVKLLSSFSFPCALSSKPTHHLECLLCGLSLEPKAKILLSCAIKDTFWKFWLEVIIINFKYRSRNWAELGGVIFISGSF